MKCSRVYVADMGVDVTQQFRVYELQTDAIAYVRTVQVNLHVVISLSRFSFCSAFVS